ncbi:MAG: 30S ribosomal protein S11 [Candidatus Magasanikbacteria bacterium]|nr:30S ribosomal protein S11 [Candidatus Magasanikbacteria bacterium]
MVKKIKKGLKKKSNLRSVSHGRAYIQATFNNTIVTITDQNGDVIGWGSAGGSGFKGPKKSTPYAAGVVVKNVVEAVKEYGVKEVNVFVKGIGGGREGAIRALNTNGIQVLSVKDMTPMPHNGCRAPKRRRV